MKVDQEPTDKNNGKHFRHSIWRAAVRIEGPQAVDGKGQRHYGYRARPESV